ncbi:MAG: DUF4124 domain-containing protein [Candidatus Dadabacteria bacterium]|nr:MAG: DUF4124 domain-containing protein [Candidatus Dadabacteria bacterium]
MTDFYRFKQLGRETAFFYFILIFIAFPTLSYTQTKIYKWTDKDGVVHYSSKKPKGVETAKPAKLPKITKADIKVPSVVSTSCKHHGGIDCEAGADKDGSVICRDGYRDSLARFQFMCSSPKLLLDNISKLDETGSFSVTVRNKRGVKAEGVNVYYVYKDGKVLLKGPKEISSFGAAQFSFDPSSVENPHLNLKRKPSKGDIKITCLNC